MRAAVEKQEAEYRVAEATAAKREKVMGERPTLTADTVVEYLDWVVKNAAVIGSEHVPLHMTAAELAIRTRATDAQAKDTQHTLVRDGVIEAPAL